jgi:hypothetical protein
MTFKEDVGLELQATVLLYCVDTQYTSGMYGFIDFVHVQFMFSCRWILFLE